MSEQTDDVRDPVGWILTLAAMLRRLRELDETIQAIDGAGTSPEESTTTSEHP